MASADGRAPTHQCGAAISIKALRDAVHAYAKSKNISEFSKKKDVNTKNRDELVGLIHGWSDFPIDACCAARNVPRGRPAVQQTPAPATEVAADHQEAPETSSAEYSPAFVSTERLVELLNGAGKTSTGDRNAMLSRCVKAGLIAQADADVRAEFFGVEELRRRLVAHNVELPPPRQGRNPLVSLCLQHKLITSDEAEAKGKRKPAVKMPVDARAKLKADVRDGDPPMIVVKNSLRGLLRFAGFDCDGAKRSDKMVRAVVDAADRTHLLVTHAYQLVKQVKLRQYAANAAVTMPTAGEYKAAMYAVSKEGAPNDEEGNKAMADAFADAYVDTLLPEGFEGDASQRLAEARRHLPLRSGLSNVIVFQSVDMAKNAMNSPMMHYANRLRQWVNVAFDVRGRAEAAHAQPGTKEERKARAAAVRARFRDVKDDLLSDAEELKSEPEFHSWVVQQRADLHPPRRLEEGSVHYDVTVHPGDYLRQSIELTGRMQLVGARGFHALPHRSSFVPGYITMDTRALTQVLGIKRKKKDTDGGEGEDDCQAWEVKQGVWRGAGFGVHTRSFRRGAKGGSRYVFRHTLMTDGVGASVVLVRSDLRDQVRNIKNDDDEGLSNKERLNAAKMRRAGLRGAEALAGKESYVGVQHAAEWLAKGKRIVPIDPGVLDALYCGEDAGDGKLRTLRYTLAQRLRESKRTRYKTLHTLVKEQQGAVHAGRTVDQCYTALGGDAHSCKTVDKDAYDAMLRERNAMLPAMARHHAGAHLAGRRCLDGGMYRRLRWNAWVNRQRADDAFMQRFRQTFGPPSTTLVVFGDWGGTKTLRGWVSTPKGASWRRLFRAHGYTVVLNDEGRTTKCCSSCHAGETSTFLVAPDPRKNPRRDGMPRPDRKVHGLLKCEGCDKHHNRNKNAVANQLRAAMAALRGLERPEGLRRKQHQ